MTTIETDVIHASVVICTRNRPDKIGTAVGSVLALDYPAFDVTVIDQSTTDDTRPCARRRITTTTDCAISTSTKPDCRGPTTTASGNTHGRDHRLHGRRLHRPDTTG